MPDLQKLQEQAWRDRGEPSGCLREYVGSADPIIDAYLSLSPADELLLLIALERAEKETAA